MTRKPTESTRLWSLGPTYSEPKTRLPVQFCYRFSEQMLQLCRLVFSWHSKQWELGLSLTLLCALETVSHTGLPLSA